MIPYIADVLNVNEQELFEFNIEYSTQYNYKQSKEIREIIELLQYLPNSAIIDLKKRLYEYKMTYDKGFNKILK